VSVFAHYSQKDADTTFLPFTILFILRFTSLNPNVYRRFFMNKTSAPLHHSTEQIHRITWSSCRNSCVLFGRLRIKFLTWDRLTWLKYFVFVSGPCSYVLGQYLNTALHNPTHIQGHQMDTKW